MFSTFCLTYQLTVRPIAPKPRWISLTLKPQLNHQTTWLNDKQPKCPHFAWMPSLWRSKILNCSHKDRSALTRTHMQSLHPLSFHPPLSGQCNGWWICCLLMHTADKLSLSEHGRAAVWFVKDGTRQDESAAQIEKGHWGYRQTSLKRCIWRKLYIWGLTGRQGANELWNMWDTFWQWPCCVLDYENFPLVYLYGGIWNHKNTFTQQPMQNLWGAQEPHMCKLG